MRRIQNPWIQVEGYNCYGCSPDNPKGMHMTFYEENEADINGDIVSLWQPTMEHQSWINTLHGGVQATLLDEICGWVVFKKLRTSGVTAKMELRYRRAVMTNKGSLVLRARLQRYEKRVAVVVGEITDKEGNILTQCECTYFTFPDEKAQQMGFREATLDAQDLSLDSLLS